MFVGKIVIKAPLVSKNLLLTWANCNAFAITAKTTLFFYIWLLGNEKSTNQVGTTWVRIFVNMFIITGIGDGWRI